MPRRRKAQPLPILCAAEPDRARQLLAFMLVLEKVDLSREERASERPRPRRVRKRARLGPAAPPCPGA